MPLCYFNVIDVSRDDTETSGSEQDSEPELPGDVIEPLLCSKKCSYDFLHLYDSKPSYLEIVVIFWVTLPDR